MEAVFILVFTLIAVAFILAIGSGGVRTPPTHKTTDKESRDMPGYLD